MQRRSYGTGCLFTARGKWYGQVASRGPADQAGDRPEAATRLPRGTDPQAGRGRAAPADADDQPGAADGRDHLRGRGERVPALRRGGPADRPEDAHRLPGSGGGLPARGVRRPLARGGHPRPGRRLQGAADQGGEALEPDHRPPPDGPPRDLQAGEAGLGPGREPGLRRSSRAPQGHLHGRVRHLRPRRDRAAGRRRRGRAGRGDLQGGRVHRPAARGAAGAPLVRRRLHRRAAPRPPQLHRRPGEGAEGQAGPVGADDARGDRRAGEAQGAGASSPATTTWSSPARAST